MKTYILFGAGGTGSQFLPAALAYLRNWHANWEENGADPEWEFLIVDGDSYEHKNLSRQLFDPSFVGLNKAEAMAQMYAHYPVQAIPRFVGEDDLQKLIEDNTTIFIGVDNFSLRALVEERVLQLQNAIVINAGNEMHDGNVQLWVRENGKNLTPQLSFCHPEIRYIGNDDRASMSCMQVAQLPGGEQLIIANMAAAQNMLTMLWRYNIGLWKEKNTPTEVQFDLKQGVVDHIDMRLRRGWSKDRAVVKEGLPA